MNVHISADNISLKTDIEGKVELVLSVTKDTAYAIKNAHSELKQGLKSKKLSVELKWESKKRSLDANAYLWKLLQLIAEVIKSTKDAVYLEMLQRYGVFTHIIVKPEAVERVMQEWRTARVLGEVTVNGKTGVQIQCYYGSHLYSSKEFSVLLDGVISEAKELGIEIISDSEIDLLKREWNK